MKLVENPIQHREKEVKNGTIHTLVKRMWTFH